MEQEIILEGHVSIEAAIKAKNREVYEIFIKKNKGYRDTAKLEKLAKMNNIPVKRVSTDFINSKAQGQTHGGIIATVGMRKLVSLDDLIKGKKNPFIVMLDGIEDPFNFGFAVRSLYAAGADGLVVRNRNWMSAAGVVTKSSAGATELIPTAAVETAEEAAEFFKSKGLNIACTANKDAVDIYDADLTSAIFLLIGGEKRGITRSFLSRADLLLRIPYGRNYNASLTASSSSAIIAFEAMRQRR